MKSICIKTNNPSDLNYLLNLLENSNQPHICFSCHNFKHYKNLIIHYTGNLINDFISEISEFLSYLVIENYEENILKRLIFSNYFYFDSQERNVVLNICSEILPENDYILFEDRQKELIKIFYDYLLENNKIILDGFINFRLKEYISFLNSIIDTAVNKFIVEREYLEFISLLKVYINSEVSSVKCIHLIYNDENTILLDENKNIIDIDKDAFKAKYLSDITFSSNDYALNTLLNILPEKIYIHLVEGSIDEFINTLQLVFENRIEICKNCSICNIYKNNKQILNEK